MRENPDRRYKYPYIPPKRCGCGNKIITHDYSEKYTKCSMCRRKDREELSRR